MVCLFLEIRCVAGVLIHLLASPYSLYMKAETNMKNTNLKFKSLIASALVAAAAVALPAGAYEIQASGLSDFALAPSADRVTINAGTATTANLGSFLLQTGNYFVGNSGFLSGTFNYNVNQEITIDGQSLIVPFALSNRVSNPDQDNTDSLTISQVDPVFFSDANVFFNISTYQSPNVGVIGQNTPFSLSGFLAAGPVIDVPPEQPVTGEIPEPSSMALMLAGSLGLMGFASRRRARAAAKA